MPGAQGRDARRLLIASLFLCLSTVATAGDPDTIAAKQALTRQLKSSASVSNGILTVDYDTSSGQFSIRTGSSHPSPGQTVFYPTGTSYITLRDADSQEMFTNCNNASTPGISGYSTGNMCATPPMVTSLGNGFRAVFTLSNWIVQQDVQINGSTIADTNVSQTVRVTNTTHSTREYGVRYLWDWMVAGNDSSYFRARSPDGTFLGPQQFTNFPSPTFQLFEEVDNPTSPRFSVYGTVGSGSLIPTPTTPDEVRYCSWGAAYSSAWDFTTRPSDSATVHYWGFNRPLRLRGGETAAFVEYVTTQLSAVTPRSAQVSVSSSSLAFGDVPVGSASASQSVTITSSGDVPYQINSFGSTPNCQASAFCDSGDFICSTDCATAPTSYGMNASCHVSASFAPNTTGPQSSVIYICDNAAGSPRTLTFTGNGVVPPPVMITPSQWNFGDAIVGNESAVKSFRISNPGSVEVAIGPVKANGEFIVKSTTCGASIPASSGCGADVVFAPTLPGAITGSLEVSAAASRGLMGKVLTDVAPTSATAPLYGNGIHEAQLNMPSAVDMGAYTLGDPPLRQLVEVRSTGDAVAGITSVSVTSPFTVANGCPVNIAPGTLCNLVLEFTTTTLGDFSGTLTVDSGGPGGSRSIPVRAHSVRAPHPEIVLSTNSIGFGDRLLGTTSASQRVTITNAGNADAALGPITTTTLDFLVTSGCGFTLAPQSTCFADVSLRPVGFGPRFGQMIFTSNAEGSPHTVNLGGTGCRPFIRSTGRLGSSFNCSP